MDFNSKILYKDWIWDWLLDKKYYIKESTYANYSNLVSNHIEPYLGKYYLDELNNKIIQRFLLDKHQTGKLNNSGGLSNKTIKDIATIIKSSLKCAVKEGLMHNLNLDFIYPKATVKEKIHTLSKQNQNKLTKYVMKNQSPRTLGTLLTLYSGIRLGELCALQWKDVDFKNNILHINKTLQRVYIKDSNINNSKVIITSPKTQNAEREIPLNNNFAKILKKYKTNPEDYVLSCNSQWVEPRTYSRYFEGILKKAKIEKINFHALRHTFATNCIKLGVDYKTVSELLGHSTVNITLNLYVHPHMSQKKKCINLICRNLQKATA